MSKTVKVGDVIALPVGIEPREGDPNFVRLYDASNFSICPRIAKMFAVAVKDAINNHDRMREALERIAEGEWDERLHGNGIANEFMQIAAAALQACDAQQENTNG